MSQLSSTVSLPRLAYKGIPVVTTETLALAYEVDAVSIRKNFSCNKERFTEGKHFYSLSGNELREFKNCVTESNSVGIGKRTSNLTLWTERGAARHAKMLNSDRAWDMFELLEETFFRVAERQTIDGPLSPDLRAELKALVDAKLSMVPEDVQGKARAELWTRFDRFFKIAEYAQLPAHKMPEARDYIINLELRALRGVESQKPVPVKKSLPKPKECTLATNRKEIEAMQKKLELLCQTVQLAGLSSTSLGGERAERLLTESRNRHVRTAVNCLIMARMALVYAVA